jgi:integrase
MPRKRANRQGGLFQCKGKDENGTTVLKSANWSAQYYVDGRQIRKSTGTPIRSEAEKILRKWMSDSELGLKPPPQTKGLSYDELRADLLSHYAEKKHKSLKTRSDGTPYLFPLTALDTFFSGRKVNSIDRDAASTFIRKRRDEGAKESTINNSLRLLIRMFSLAQANGKLTTAPKIELLKERSRQGFLPHESFQKLFDAMPARLQPLLLLLYQTGVRPGEAEQIQWPAVDLHGARITLLEGETKNGQSRTLPLSAALVELLSAVKHREGAVFPSKRSLQAAWKTATAKAGIEGLLIHDLRRSAVRNMMKAGAQQAEAMKISGHKDASVFQRYNVIDEQQTANVMQRVQKLVPVKIQRALPARKKASR